MLTRSPLVALALVSLASVANAATLTNVTGTVSVNQGAGFGSAVNGQQLNPGDRVTVASGGTARVDAGPNCIVTITGGQTFTIPVPGQACVAPASAGGGGMPVGTGAAGLSPELAVGGAVVAGAAVVGIIAATNSSSNSTFIIPRPVSP